MVKPAVLKFFDFSYLVKVKHFRITYLAILNGVSSKIWYSDQTPPTRLWINDKSLEFSVSAFHLHKERKYLLSDRQIRIGICNKFILHS